MIQVAYRVAASSIAGAGQGIFLAQDVRAGQVLVYPDAIPETLSFTQILGRPDRELALAATVRWFEERYTVSLDWPDECFINHAFEPSGLWHLGFVFAHRHLHPGTELTIDYRHLLAPGQVEAFRDAQSGREIVGFSWAESLRTSAQALAELSVKL